MPKVKIENVSESSPKLPVKIEVASRGFVCFSSTVEGAAEVAYKTAIAGLNADIKKAVEEYKTHNVEIP